MSKKPVSPPAEFADVLQVIQAGRCQGLRGRQRRTHRNLWAVGAYLSQEVAVADWGKGIVTELASWLLTTAPNVKGFSASNLWRMKQFYATWNPLSKLATALRELSWSKHLLPMAQCKTAEEREFYLISATRARWSHRELQRQIRTSAFERTLLADRKLAPLPKVLPPGATGVFKVTYRILSMIGGLTAWLEGIP